MEGDLFPTLIERRQRELQCRPPTGMHVRWMPRLVDALGAVSKFGALLELPHSDHTDAHNYRNALLNLAAVALAAMPRAKGS